MLALTPIVSQVGRERGLGETPDAVAATASYPKELAFARGYDIVQAPLAARKVATVLT